MPDRCGRCAAALGREAHARVILPPPYLSISPDGYAHQIRFPSRLLGLSEIASSQAAPGGDGAHSASLWLPLPVAATSFRAAPPEMLPTGEDSGAEHLHLLRRAGVRPQGG